ncbi:MAG: glucose-6-phosphate isomerase [Clostridia bacterium]|nr:glucose-6-phosphate isomerase [Clostridia bacterium]
MQFEHFGPVDGMQALMAPAAECWRSLSDNPQYQDVLGWLDCRKATEGYVQAVLDKAAQWRAMADTLVVVGVGGSNQAARGVIDALGSRGMNIVWAGNTLSAYELNKTLKALEGHSVVMHVIAKNFETLEPGSHYRVLRHWMEQRYTKEEMADRVVLTGTEGSRLHEMAIERGHLFLPFPKPVGGRYTAFTVVGLLPIAAAGLDVGAYLQGGLDAQKEINSSPDNAAFRYAAWRNAQLQRGFDVEMLVSFEPRFERLGRWWRQLFGESEGKDGKGIYPACAIYSEDLHSIGQYVQAGKRFLAETFLSVKDDGADVPVPEDKESRDGFDYLDGSDFTFINKAAEAATLQAHEAGGVPCARFSVDRCDEYAFGQLYYTFMAACAVSGQLLGVNPFDQEGVEAYKRSMFAILGK